MPLRHYNFHKFSLNYVTFLVYWSYFTSFKIQTPLSLILEFLDWGIKFLLI